MQPNRLFWKAGGDAPYPIKYHWQCNPIWEFMWQMKFMHYATNSFRYASCEMSPLSPVQSCFPRLYLDRVLLLKVIPLIIQLMSKRCQRFLGTALSVFRMVTYVGLSFFSVSEDVLPCGLLNDPVLGYFRSPIEWFTCSANHWLNELAKLHVVVQSGAQWLDRQCFWFLLSVRALYSHALYTCLGITSSVL